MDNIIDCKNLIDNKIEDAKKILELFNEKYPHLTPSFHIFSIGDIDGCKAYVKMKKEKCKELGIKVIHHEYEPIKVIQRNTYFIGKEIEKCIIEPVMIQLPVEFDSKWMNGAHKWASKKLINYINPICDVDGLKEGSKFKPCTSLSMYEIGLKCIKEVGETSYEGKNILVIGRSRIVGKPLAEKLLDANGNITITHSHTSPQDLKMHIKNSDIIFSCTGVDLGNITSPQLLKGKIVIDSGYLRDENGKLRGDIPTKHKVLCKKYNKPTGSVGPLTIAFLMEAIAKANYDNMNNINLSPKEE